MSSGGRRARVRARTRTLRRLRRGLRELVLGDPVVTKAFEAAEPSELLDSHGSINDAQRGCERAERIRNDGPLKRSAGARQSAFMAPCDAPYRPPRACAMACARKRPRSASAMPACIAPSSSRVRASRSLPFAATTGSHVPISARAGGRIVTRPGVERLRAVSERVHRRPDRLVTGEVERERGLVHDRDGVRAGSAGLCAPHLVAHAEVRRPLGARVRRRHRYEREARGRGDRLRRVDRAAAPERHESVRVRCGLRRSGDHVDRRMAANAGEALGDRQLQGREALARHEQRRTIPKLGEKRAEPVDTPANDHVASRSRAKATNASATRVRARPVAEAREISRVASRPSTRASVSRPAASSDSTAVREMNVTP